MEDENLDIEDILASRPKQEQKRRKWDTDGLCTYEPGKPITPGFIREMRDLCSIIYSSTYIKCSLEEFTSEAVEKVIEGLPTFDPEKGVINSWVYTVIYNLSRTLMYTLAFETDGEIDEEEYQTSYNYIGLGASIASRERERVELQVNIFSFATMAYRLGIHVDQKLLYKYLTLKESTPTAELFLWLNYKSKFSREG